MYFTKKISASTLMETLVATVLIVVLFMVSSMVLNNLFSTSIRFNQNEIRQELSRLRYKHNHEQLQLPYDSSLNDWNIQIFNENWQGKSRIIFNAKNEITNQEIRIRQ